MAQWLKVLAALPEVQSSVPNTHLRRHSSSRYPHRASTGTHASENKCECVHTHSNTHINEKSALQNLPTSAGKKDQVDKELATQPDDLS